MALCGGERDTEFRPSYAQGLFLILSRIFFPGIEASSVVYKVITLLTVASLWPGFFFKLLTLGKCSVTELAWTPK